MRYILGLFILLGLASCGNDEDEDGTSVENNFHIEGQINGASLLRVKIEAQSERGPILVGEVMTDVNGNYKLDGNIPGMGIYSMSVGADQRNAIAIPLDKNDNAKISGNLNTFSLKPKISGTKWAKPLMQYMDKFNDFAITQMEEMPKIKDEAEQLKKFQELKKPLDEFVRKAVSKDPSNPVNIIFTSSLLPGEMGMLNWDPENLEVLKTMHTAYRKDHSDSPITDMLGQQIAYLENEIEKNAQFTSGSMSAPEIAMKNPAGTEMRLSNLKGKVVLIDFWASWCQPCRRENPKVIAMYKKYKAKGFEIFSVSLDQDPAAWKAAIAKDGLIWPNHVSDLLGWQTPLTQIYGFQSIPHTVLVNREGNIVAVGLRGADLEQKLIETLSK